MKSRTRSPEDERGAVAIIVAVFATCMFILGAIVVELGQARDVRQQAQIAADASALAGANALYPVSGTCTNSTLSPCLLDAENQVKGYAGRNFGVGASAWSNASCAVPAGFFQRAGSVTRCISFDSLSSPSKVFVQIPARRVTFGLGSLAGADHVDLGAAARANLGRGGQGRCSLCFLGGVTVGNGDFDIRGSSVHVNGDLDVGEQSYWTAGQIWVAGTWPAADLAHFTAVPTKVEKITDPFATDSRFTPSTSHLAHKTGSPCAGGPGIYGEYSWGANENCTLSPGLYVVEGTWGLKNNSGIHGHGVTLYVTTGSLDFKNSGIVDLQAPTTAQAASTGGVADWVIIHGRANSNPISLQGNGETTNDGTGCTAGGTPSLVGGVYAPAAPLSANGNSCLAISMGPVVVVGVDSSPSGDFNGNKSGLLLVNGREIAINNIPKELALDR